MRKNRGAPGRGNSRNGMRSRFQIEAEAGMRGELQKG